MVFYPLQPPDTYEAICYTNAYSQVRIYFLQHLRGHWHYRCGYELRLDVILVAVKMEKDKLTKHEKG